MYNLLYGSGQIGSVILSVVAGVIALSLFRVSHNEQELHAWKPLIIALVLFAVEEILGAIRTFGFSDVAAISWLYPWITHVLPGFILAFTIQALIIEVWLQ